VPHTCARSYVWVTFDAKDIFCSHRIWTFYILFFLILVFTAAALSFIFGRLVDIVVQPSFDMTQYTEVPVFGDLTDDDQIIYYQQAQVWQMNIFLRQEY
jgi:hypothetical protein